MVSPARRASQSIQPAASSPAKSGTPSAAAHAAGTDTATAGERPPKAIDAPRPPAAGVDTDKLARFLRKAAVDELGVSLEQKLAKVLAEKLQSQMANGSDPSDVDSSDPEVDIPLLKAAGRKRVDVLDELLSAEAEPRSIADADLERVRAWSQRYGIPVPKQDKQFHTRLMQAQPLTDAEMASRLQTRMAGWLRDRYGDFVEDDADAAGLAQFEKFVQRTFMCLGHRATVEQAGDFIRRARAAAAEAKTDEDVLEPPADPADTRQPSHGASEPEHRFVLFSSATDPLPTRENEPPEHTPEPLQRAATQPASGADQPAGPETAKRKAWIVPDPSNIPTLLREKLDELHETRPRDGAESLGTSLAAWFDVTHSDRELPADDAVLIAQAYLRQKGIGQAQDDAASGLAGAETPTRAGRRPSSSPSPFGAQPDTAGTFFDRPRSPSPFAGAGRAAQGTGQQPAAAPRLSHGAIAQINQAIDNARALYEHERWVDLAPRRSLLTPRGRFNLDQALTQIADTTALLDRLPERARGDAWHRADRALDAAYRTLQPYR